MFRPLLNGLAVSLVATLLSGWTGELRAQADAPGLGPPGSLVRIAFEDKGDAVLRGRDARWQLLVTGEFSSRQRHDLSREVTYTASPADIVEVDETGFVTPKADGEVTITAEASSGETAETTLLVEQIATDIPINFPNQIVPIFTKLGCNAGGCHGKSSGQNGFKLSLLGFYPDEDYVYLVKENRGRRIFPAAPEYSLLLSKPTNLLPHGGGRRMDPAAYETQLVTRWIAQGMPYGSEDDPVVERIEVFPRGRSMNRGADQQLSVIAYYSDGSAGDVTRIAQFESNDAQMAETTASGIVKTLDMVGDVAVMVRFQGQVAVFRAAIPLGAAVANLPQPRNFVDTHVFNKLTVLGIPPSPVCDDATFIRRSSLDIAGRLPTADEAIAFQASEDPAKRDKLIERLLTSPGYGDYFANKWNAVLRNTRGPDQRVTFGFHDWVRRSIQQNMPYDEFVRNILAATGDPLEHPPSRWYTDVNTPLEQTEDTAQLFLGLRIQCARCHHHPFEQWSQNDYYGFLAFFSRVGRKPSRTGVGNIRVFHNPGAATANNPRTNQPLKPTGLGGEPLDLPPYEDPRHHLVDWMAAPDNPFFARALVNRYWKHFFGRGIVDPEDDMRVTNPPSNPQLLDALAKSFIDSGFDLKALVRTICQSKTYQLSSEPNEYNVGDKQNFSSYYPKRLNAEVLYDALNQVTATNAGFQGVPTTTRAVQLPDSGFNSYFLSVFGKPQAQSACECERSAEANLAQSLHLLNSAEVQGKLASATGRAAQLVAEEEVTEQERVRRLYFWVYGRPPEQDEFDLILPHIAKTPDKKQAYEDVLWALINTKEFLFNH